MTIVVPPSPVQPVNPGSTKGGSSGSQPHNVLVAGVVGSVVGFFVVGICALCVLIYVRKRQRNFKSAGSKNHQAAVTPHRPTLALQVEPFLISRNASAPRTGPVSTSSEYLSSYSAASLDVIASEALPFSSTNRPRSDPSTGQPFGSLKYAGSASPIHEASQSSQTANLIAEALSPLSDPGDTQPHGARANSPGPMSFPSGVVHGIRSELEQLRRVMQEMRDGMGAPPGYS
ncbi:hypothetical protein C8Q79DRAFT_966922, partial [Trametes meyenii]